MSDINKLLENLQKTEAAHKLAQTKLDEAVGELPIGTVYRMSNGEAYHVIEQQKTGKHILRPVFSARELAIMRGEEVPPLKTRVKKAT